MSIKALINISHSGKKYKIGELISDITRKDAEILINNDYAIKVDDKFKLDANLKKVFARKRRIRKTRELEMHYCGF